MKKKKKILAIVFIVLLVGIGIWRWQVAKKPKVEYSTVKVVRGQLMQTVSETGSTKPLNELELNFQSSGKVAIVNVKIGDQVKKDQSLASLDAVDLQIRLNQSEAQLSVAQIQLQKLLAGASAEDIGVSSANRQSAQAAYQSAQSNLEQVDKITAEAIAQAEKTYGDLASGNAFASPVAQSVTQASTNLGNAKKTYQQNVDSQTQALAAMLIGKLPQADAALDAIDRILSDQTANDFLGVKNSQSLQAAHSTYGAARQAVDDGDTSLVTLNSSSVDSVRQTYISVYKAMNTTFNALNQTFNVLGASISSASFSQAQLDTFKTSINTQIATISTAISSLEASKQSLDSAILALDTNSTSLQTALDQSKSNLTDATTKAFNALKTARLAREQQMATAKAGVESASKALAMADAQYGKTVASARPEDIALAQAQVLQSKASVDLIRNQIANNQILAPVDGIITAVNYKPGEQTGVGQPAIKMIAQDGYEVEIDVAETDIAKIKLEDKASITLDAYGDAVKLAGRVVFIEPAATIIQGVIYYKVKIDFLAGQLEIKPSMTATVDISTARKDNVLTLPARAVLDKGGQKYVRILENGSSAERSVKTGLTGDGGVVEILSGLSEGEEVVTFIKYLNGTTAP